MKYDLHSNESETSFYLAVILHTIQNVNLKMNLIKIFKFNLLSTCNAQTTSMTFLYLPSLFYQVWRNLLSQLVGLNLCLFLFENLKKETSLAQYHSLGVGV